MTAYPLEHRAVAEKMLGRPLSRYEVVHHLNGDPADNRPENLRVMEHGEHVRLHHALRSAVVSGEQLREMREALGLSRERAAGLIGIASKTIERWEAERNRPRGDLVRQLVRAYEKVA